MLVGVPAFKSFAVRASLFVSAYVEGGAGDLADAFSPDALFPGPVSRDQVTVEDVEVLGPAAEHPELVPLEPAGDATADGELDQSRKDFADDYYRALGYTDEQRQNWEVLLAARADALVVLSASGPDDIGPEDTWEALPEAIDFAALDPTIAVDEAV